MSEMALSEERPVRRFFHNEEWWFVLIDIVSALTDSPAPSDYHRSHLIGTGTSQYNSSLSSPRTRSEHRGYGQHPGQTSRWFARRS
jgi:prophage antirepressor-like protein